MFGLAEIEIDEDLWLRSYPIIRAENAGGTTVAVSVPVAAVFAAIGAYLHVEFDVEEQEDRP